VLLNSLSETSLNFLWGWRGLLYMCSKSYVWKAMCHPLYFRWCRRNRFLRLFLFVCRLSRVQSSERRYWIVCFVLIWKCRRLSFYCRYLLNLKQMFSRNILIRSVCSFFLRWHWSQDSFHCLHCFRHANLTILHCLYFNSRLFRCSFLQIFSSR